MTLGTRASSSFMAVNPSSVAMSAPLQAPGTKSVSQVLALNVRGVRECASQAVVQVDLVKKISLLHFSGVDYRIQHRCPVQHQQHHHYEIGALAWRAIEKFYSHVLGFTGALAVDDGARSQHVIR
jgi:hypothetical protein